MSSDLFSLLPEEPSSSASEETIELFVDEAGDPFLFNRHQEVIVNTNGCSQFFMMGKVEIDEPAQIAQHLTDLRLRLVHHPYFAGVESFRPERKKTALLFHAKNDLPEVRFQVFDLLHSLGKSIRFHAVVVDKLALVKAEQAKREQDPTYRYQPNALYDSLVRSLFSKFHRLADRYELCVAKRGKSDRNHALTAALEHAERDF